MGEKPIYELITESGRAINTTGNHPYLVELYSEEECEKYAGDVWNKDYDKFNGEFCTRWVSVNELKDGDEIAVQRFDDMRKDKEGNEFSANYPNNSIISLFDNISTLNCSLNAGSFDHIGQFNFNASAKNATSLSCISCLACCSNSLNEFFGTNLINLDTSDNFELNCSELNSEYFNTSDLLFFNSSIAYSGESNCKFNDLDLEMISLMGLGLKNDTNIFVSTTNFIYQPSALYLFHIPSLILSPILRASLLDSSSDSNCLNICSFHNNCLTFNSMTVLTNPDQLISGNFFICSLVSPGTDNVIDTMFSVEKHKDVELFKPFDFGRKGMRW